MNHILQHFWDIFWDSPNMMFLYKLKFRQTVVKSAQYGKKIASRLTWKIFREINIVWKLLGSDLLSHASHIFYKNFVKVTFLLSKEITLHTKKLIWQNIFRCWECGNNAQCGNHGILVSHFFGKNFVKATVLLNKSLKSWFDEIFFLWDQIFHFSTLWAAHTVWKNEKFTAMQFFPSN